MTRRYILGEDELWRADGHAPIGGEPDPGIPTTPTPLLPFDMPTRAGIVALPRKVWSHAFVTYPYGGDQRANTGATWYQARMPGGTLNPTYGGELRDRPLEISGVTRPRTEPSWWILDRAQEILQARDAGHAGFTIDWLNLNDGTGDNRTGQVREFCDAVRYLNVQDDFKIILMPDGSASLCDGGNFTAFVNKTVNLLTTYSDMMYRDSDGKWVIAPYFPEGAPSAVVSGSRVLNTSASATAAYWTNYIAAMSTAGFEVKLWFCYVRAWHTTAYAAPALSSIGAMNSRWGDRDYTSSGAETVNNRLAPAKSHAAIADGGYNRPWMHPISVQDNRCGTSESPKSWEPGGSRNLTATWMAAIDGSAEMVQIPTWSDFREHAHVMPSIHHGHVWLDISSYFQYKWSVGEWPTVHRDAVYLSHNLHRKDMPNSNITGTQTNFMVNIGSSPYVSDVEALVFLTSTANVTVEININGAVTTFTPGALTLVAAGSNVYRFSKTMPTAGTASATVKRNGIVVATITSPHTMTDHPVAQDHHLRAVGSLRGIES